MKKFFLLLFLSFLSLNIKATEQYNVTINNIKYYLLKPNWGESTASVKGVTNKSESVVIPEKVYYNGDTWQVTSISALAFKDDNVLKEISLPPSLTSISSGAFQNCTKLKKIIIPSNVSNLDTEIFYGCVELKDIIFLTSSVKTVASNNFKNCSPNLRIAYPDNSSTSLVNNIPSGSGIVYPSDDYILIEDNFIFSKDKSILYFATTSYFDKTQKYNLPEETVKIGERSFQYCNITEIYLSKNIQEIGERAFDDCSYLESINIPGSTTIIGENAFANTTNLTEVIFQRNPNGGDTNQINITTPFTGSAVKTLSIGRDVVGQYGFGESLQQVTVTASVNSIGETAFKNCTGLTSVTINPGNLTSIGTSAFEGCSSLPLIIIPDNVISLGNSIFSGCSSLQDVTLSSQITAIPQNAFYNCQNLTTITLPKGVTSIGTSAFQNCSVLPTINLPSGLTQIADFTFSGCSKLNNISLPENVSSLGNNAFTDCSSLTQIGLSMVETLGNNSFQNCSSLKEVVFGEKLKAIPDYGFDGCSELLDVQLPDDITTIGNYAFNDNTNLATVKLPVNLTTINSYAFNGCSPLTEICFPAQVKNINEYAFADCDQLTSVYSLNSVPPTCQNKTVFSDQAYANASLYVPTDYLEDYQYSTVWKEFYSKEGLTEVKKIEISSVNEKNRVRVNKSLELIATVTPEDATFTKVNWSSNNPNVASVKDGTVTAVSPGFAVITATATDFTALSGTFEVEVIDFLLGDSNESDDVTVTDAVNIASHVLGKNPQPFNFEASDVNEDESISFADASGVISIVLDDASVASYSLTRAINEYSDNLFIEDFAISDVQPVEVAVSLQSPREFVALQADIKTTDGLKIEDILPSPVVEETHMVTLKRVSDESMRIIMFSPAMNTLPDGSETLFKVAVSGTPEREARIIISNILATTSALEEYELGTVGGNINNGTTEVNELQQSVYRVISEYSGISVLNAEGLEIRIINLSGVTIAHTECASENNHYSLQPGIYVVVVGDKSEKVIVK